MSWVYWQSEPGLWTVGYYTPTFERRTDSDHSDQSAAAARVHWLNGGRGELTKEDLDVFREECRAAVDQAIVAHVSAYHHREA